MVLTCAAGYTGPGLFGLGAAALLAAGHAVGLLWALLGLLALLLVQIRNWYGLWSVLVTGAPRVRRDLVAARRGPGRVRRRGHLVPAAGRAARRPGAADRPPPPPRRRTPTPTSWPDSPACPALVWVGVFLLVDVGALLLGGCWLLACASARQRRAAPPRGSQPFGWCTGSTCGAGGMSSTEVRVVDGDRRPWCRISSGSPSTSR